MPNFTQTLCVITRTQLTSEFIHRITEILNKFNVDYVVTGGTSKIIRGEDYLTFDLDIVVENSNDNLNRVNKFVHQITSEKIDLTDNFKSNRITRINTFPFSIDIMPRLDGLENINIFKNSELVEFEGRKIPCISESDLMKNYKSFKT
ncbi:hypothetical protein K6119_07960 [Paracrocinitomix mangrovi]|uniref:hypothetical protein n=1 Tax=Paracrocinitomix mangrovi TaxID=2862509 RepID=UPI001C8DF43F|nr:hypothetical protein [Paracrocinitomix mangrovi]UKN03446.1 hypothetical protein K6119_07960 [Paracrocinitomix mangrovi]